MFETVRKHQKILQLILLLLIVPSFAFFGIESYMRNIGGEADLVKVAGQAITQAELDRAVKTKMDQIQKQQGRFDPSLAQNPMFKQSVLSELVQQRLIAYEIKALNLAVSEKALANDLNRIPEIRAMYRADGTFDADRYKQLLANNGMTVAQFEEGRKTDLMTRQALSSVMASGIYSRKVAERISQAFDIEREVQVMKFVPNDYLAKVNPSSQEIEAYYQANLEKFQNPESLDVEYVILNMAKDDPKASSERADLFANLAYEQPDSLKPIADRLKLSIQVVKGVSRAGVRGDTTHPLNQSKVLAALFSDDALKNKRNIEAQDIGSGKVLTARVVQHYPKQAQPLSQVQAEIKKIVAYRLADDLASQAAKSSYDKIKSEASVATGFGAPKMVSRNKPGDLSPAALSAVMSVNPDQLPAVVMASIESGGSAIYRVIKLQEAKQTDAKLRTNQIQAVSQLTAQTESATYFDDVRYRAGVKLLQPIK